MPATIPNDYKDLLEGPVVVTLVTLMPNGQPQATPVWCEFDGTYIYVNTARGRQKDKNMLERPKVAILAIDPQDPYRWLEIRGEVVDSTEEGGVESITRMAKLYKNADTYYGEVTAAEKRHRETRVVFRIKPTHVIAEVS